METSYDDYDRFRDLDNAFHAIIMRASGNEIGLTIVRVIHRHGGATAPLASGAPRAALKRTLPSTARYSRRSPLGTGSWPGSGSPPHIEARWDERKKRGAAART